MSTELLAQGNISLLQFYGGKQKGLSYQIGSVNEFKEPVFVELTDKEMGKIVCAYIKHKADGKA